MIKGKHSGEFCRLQARISILCRCWREMACFRKTMIQHTHHLSLQLAEVALSDNSITSHAYFHLTLRIWHSNILQLPCKCTETSMSAPIDLFSKRFSWPIWCHYHLIRLPGLEFLTSLSHICDLWLTPQILPMIHSFSFDIVTQRCDFLADRWHCRDCKEDPKPPQGQHKKAATRGLHPGQGWHCCNCW